jgi:hypothetical protein
MYRRLASRPGPEADPVAEKQIAQAASAYLAGTGCFQSWEEHIKEGVIYEIDEVCVQIIRLPRL